MVCLLMLTLMGLARPLYAGWVPRYVTAQGLPDGVLLEWATSSEYNLSGFEILCKRVDEPDEAFHPIGSVPAAGSLDAGAAYNYFVDSGLEPGQRYCFRIQEIAFTEEPPEYRDVCGYGLGLAPGTDGANADAESADSIPVADGLGQPTGTIGSVEVLGTALFPGSAPVAPPGVQSTVQPGIQPSGATPTPITINPLAPGAVSMATVAPIPIAPPIGEAQSANPTPPGALDPNSLEPPAAPPFPPVTPTPSQIGESPLYNDPNQFIPTPMGDPAQSDAFNSPAGASIDPAGLDGANSPLNNGAQQAAPGLDDSERYANEQFAGQQYNTDRYGQAESPLMEPNAYPAPADESAAGAVATATAMPPTPESGSAPAADLNGAVGQADPAYLVVTATSTVEAATPAATFTPLPTVTPPPDSPLLATAANPTVENLILMTLCFIFLGAGSLGALGLTTTVLYIRSRDDRG